MRRSWFFLVLYLSIPLCAQAKSILLIGNSLSTGFGLQPGQSWVVQLQQGLVQHYPCYQLINDSIAGDTSSGGLVRFSDAIKTYHPEIAIIELGGNDGLRGLSLSALQSNLAQMIHLAQQSHAKSLVLGVRLPPNYGAPYVSAFTKIYTDLGKNYKIPVVDFLADVNKPAYMQKDSIHPNAAAQSLMLGRVWEKLEPMLNCHEVQK